MKIEINRTTHPQGQKLKDVKAGWYTSEPDGLIVVYKETNKENSSCVVINRNNNTIHPAKADEFLADYRPFTGTITLTV